MKIPNTFIPEKNLEQKTEQLLEEAKIVKEEDTSAKEKLIETLVSYLHTSQAGPRPITFYNMLAASLKNDEYLDISSVASANHVNLKLYYWIKKTGNSEIKLLFKKRSNFFSHNKTELGFATMKEENLKEFYKRLERYEKETDKRPYTSYDFVNYYIKGGLTALGSYCLALLGTELNTGINIPTMVYSLGGICAYHLGGRLYDFHCHKKNKKKMIGICNHFTENEKEAIRRALE